jgi:hypothetical protein
MAPYYLVPSPVAPADVDPVLWRLKRQKELLAAHNRAAADALPAEPRSAAELLEFAVRKGIPAQAGWLRRDPFFAAEIQRRITAGLQRRDRAAQRDWERRAAKASRRAEALRERLRSTWGTARQPSPEERRRRQEARQARLRERAARLRRVHQLAAARAMGRRLRMGQPIPVGLPTGGTANRGALAMMALGVDPRTAFRLALEAELAGQRLSAEERDRAARQQYLADQLALERERLAAQRAANEAARRTQLFTAQLAAAPEMLRARTQAESLDWQRRQSVDPETQFWTRIFPSALEANPELIWSVPEAAKRLGAPSAYPKLQARLDAAIQTGDPDAAWQAGVGLGMDRDQLLALVKTLDPDWEPPYQEPPPAWSRSGIKRFMQPYEPQMPLFSVPLGVPAIY